MNPLHYSPAQISKALVALLTALIFLAGLITSVASTGPLHAIGAWAAGVAAVLNPILVFATKMSAVVDGSTGLSKGGAA